MLDIMFIATSLALCYAIVVAAYRNLRTEILTADASHMVMNEVHTNSGDSFSSDIFAELDGYLSAARTSLHADLRGYMA